MKYNINMKKSTLSLCAAGLMAFGFASCGGHGDAVAVDNDTVISKALADSISITQGKYIGGYVLNDYMNFAANSSMAFPKEDIVKGVQLVFSGEKSQATIMGMQLGMQMLQEVKQLQAQGIDIDRDKSISSPTQRPTTNSRFLRPEPKRSSSPAKRLAARLHPKRFRTHRSAAHLSTRQKPKTPN